MKNFAELVYIVREHLFRFLTNRYDDVYSVRNLFIEIICVRENVSTVVEVLLRRLRARYFSTENPYLVGT